MNSEVVKSFLNSTTNPNAVVIIVGAIAMLAFIIAMIRSYEYLNIVFAIAIVILVTESAGGIYESYTYKNRYGKEHTKTYELTEAQYVSLMSGISAIHTDEEKAKNGITFSFTEEGKEKEFDKVLLPENAVTTKGDSYEVVVEEYDRTSQGLFIDFPEKINIITKIQEKK